MAVISATNVSGMPLKVGVYPARIMSTKEAAAVENSKWDKGVPREEIQLRVQTPRDGIVECRDFITLYPKLGKRTKGYSIFSAALFNGEEIPEGQALDTSDLVNKRVQVVVKVKNDGSGNMIDSYMPWEATTPGAAAAPKAQPASLDDDDDLADA